MSALNLAAWQAAFTDYLQNGSGEAALSAQISAQHIAAEVRLDIFAMPTTRGRKKPWRTIFRHCWQR